jgi:hypothetical protein
LNAFECFQLYLALKQHFSVDSYDFFRYNGKTNAGVASYNKRSDKYQFEKLSQNPDVFNILLAHMSEEPDMWIGDVSPNGDHYKSFRKRQVSIEYSFKEEIKKFDWPNAVETSGEHPILLKEFLRRNVSKETMVILNSIIRYAPYWNKRVNDDLVWPKINFNLRKYSPFVNFDSTKYKVIFDKNIQENT